MKRKPIFYELPKSGAYVHETFIPASECASGQYASTKRKGVQTVLCCPKGTHMDRRSRCCKRDSACVTRAKAQSVRVPIATFKKRHPALFKKLQVKEKVKA